MMLLSAANIVNTFREKSIFELLKVSKFISGLIFICYQNVI